MTKIIFAEEGWADYIYWQSQDKKKLKKINRLLKSIERDGVLGGEGKPELLRWRDGEYSRRINDKDRLVYKVTDEGIIVISCKGHYEE